MYKFYYICVLGAVAGVVYSEDKEVSAGGVSTHVKGQSGKISVYPSDKTQSDGVTINYSAIKEISEDSAEINSHSFNTFASQDFTFSNIVNDTYMDTNVSVVTFSFSAVITIGQGSSAPQATLTSEVFVFREDGTIQVDGEDFEVSAGLMKFNIKIEDWPFCNPCTSGNKNENGMYLDVEIEVKGKLSSSKSQNKEGEYMLGGAVMTVPKQVRLLKRDLYLCLFVIHNIFWSHMYSAYQKYGDK